MASRRTKSMSLARKSTELALAVPQVMGHRLTRMALAGANPSSRDRKEFNLMSSEKNLAFMQSCQAMTWQTLCVQRSFMLSWFKAVWMPWLGQRMTPMSVMTQMQNAALGIATKGLAPVHRTAVSNAQRLMFTPLFGPFSR
jgi:hypothetical protein